MKVIHLLFKKNKKIFIFYTVAILSIIWISLENARNAIQEPGMMPGILEYSRAFLLICRNTPTMRPLPLVHTASDATDLANVTSAEYGCKQVRISRNQVDLF